VKNGDSWERARKGYLKTLRKQRSVIDMMTPWVGGTYVSRAKKGDPNTGDPLVPVEVEKQRAALKFVIETAFRDEAYGLTPELVNKMTVEKWMDNPRGFMTESTWPINDQIAGTQSMALTMLLNPTTLSRVYDNEKRVPVDQDAFTLPELMTALSTEIFQEISPSKLGSSAKIPLIDLCWWIRRIASPSSEATESRTTLGCSFSSGSGIESVTTTLSTGAFANFSSA
jgi:hypothetical protein